ncbi:hypothetical protein QL093DRAFT_2096359 [Fusarium oxysporum]|nr:hypothetical protein QL093DRAFT_2096359 [Fusarium oxysporum]
MEMVKFEDECSLTPLYNAATWPGFYSSFLPPHHFTSQTLPLCQQPPFLFRALSLRFELHFESHQLLFTPNPPPNLPPPIFPSPNIYRSLYQDQLAPIKAEPLPFSTHNYLSRLPPPSLPSSNSCACCASDSPTNTQLPSPPLSSSSSCHQGAMSSSPVSTSSKSPAAVAGGSVAGLSRVSPAQARDQKIRAVLDEYEVTSPSLIQRLMPLPVGREEKRNFVRLLRLHGVSYADIKNLGELSTSLSTLRGWDRMKKPPSARPRTPRWTTRDIGIMYQAVNTVLGDDGHRVPPASGVVWRRRCPSSMRRIASLPRPSRPSTTTEVGGDIARQRANTRAQ